MLVMICNGSPSLLALHNDYTFGELLAFHSLENDYYGTMSTIPKVKVVNNIPTRKLFTLR